MKIAYLYERPVSEGEAMGAEKTFADFAKTQRLELTDLIDGGGLVSGDTLLLRAKSDLGKGKAAERHIAKVKGMGVDVIILPADVEVRTKGRPSRASIPDLPTFDLICGLWYSPAPVDHAVARASDKVGRKVDRNWMNARCGPRSGSLAEEKRQMMEGKLNTEEQDDG